jgi:hypothetical protein
MIYLGQVSQDVNLNQLLLFFTVVNSAITPSLTLQIFKELSGANASICTVQSYTGNRHFPFWKHFICSSSILIGKILLACCLLVPCFYAFAFYGLSLAQSFWLLNTETYNICLLLSWIHLLVSQWS